MSKPSLGSARFALEEHKVAAGGTRAALHGGGSFPLEHKYMNSRLVVQLFWFSLHRHGEIKSNLFSSLYLK